MREMTLQSAAAATGNGSNLNVTNQGGAVLQVTGTFVGTVTFESSVDRTNFVAIQAINLNDSSIATTTTGVGLFCIPCAGLSFIRARVSAWTSGTITVTGIAVQSAPAALAIGATLQGNSGVDIGDVDVTSIAAGETHIGQVGGEGITISQTPTVTAGAYSAGDAVGGLLTFANAARVSAGGGVITDMVIVDDAGQDVELELWLFNQTFTAIADNDAFAVAEADLENLIGIISTADGSWMASGTPSAINIECTKRFDLTGTSLFGQLCTRGTPTFAATDDVTVKIKLLQD